MKRSKWRWVVWLLVAGVVVAGAWYSMRTKPLRVETALVSEGPMQVWVSAEGRTRVRDRFVVSASIDGRLGRIDVKEGSPVKRGTVLTWITPAPLEIRSEKQREAALRAAEAERQSADAQVMRARLAVDQAARELKRLAGLVDQGIRPSQELDTARTEEASAREALNAATFVAEAAVYHVEEVRSSLLKSEAQAVAVRSPVEGVVLRIHQQSERVVTPGMPVVEIGDPRRLELVFEVLSTDAVKIRVGTDVSVLNWGGDDVLPARVRAIEPGAFTKVSALGVEEQRVNVVAEFCDEPPDLGDGYRVDGDLQVWQSAGALQVPVSALFRVGADWHVFVVRNGTASLQRVQIGQRNPVNAEVIAGLSKGDTVILYPDDRLVAGAAVGP